MPRGNGVYDEEHADEDKGAKKVPEDTPDVDNPEGPEQEPPD
ncbi:hypothetical protein [Mycolicibacterium sp. XJ870]